MNEEQRTKNEEQRQPTVSFKTVGCRLNQAETAQISGQFQDAGYVTLTFGQPSDVCVIHSCTITQNAERKCLQYARSAKRDNPGAIIVLAGCAVEADRDGILTRSGADLVVDQKQKYRLPDLLAAHCHSATLRCQALSPPLARLASLSSPIRPVFSTTRALIKVQDGCNFRCAYCIVPTARGNPATRPAPEVIDEVQSAVDGGFREIVLTGANLGCYHDQDLDLVDLIRQLEGIPALARIRLSSIELSTTEAGIIDHMAGSSKLCHSLHLPLQTGDDDLLAAMGRRYTTADYRTLVETAVSKMPRLGLGTDLLVGLPGETDQAFENTLNMIRDLPFSNLHIFPYSIRPGTRAADMPNQVPETIKKERCRILKEQGDQKRQAFAESFLGESISVLIESIDGREGKGWTSEYLEARVSRTGLAPNDIIEFVPGSSDGAVLLS